MSWASLLPGVTVIGPRASPLCPTADVAEFLGMDPAELESLEIVHEWTVPWCGATYSSGALIRMSDFIRLMKTAGMELHATEVAKRAEKIAGTDGARVLAQHTAYINALNAVAERLSDESRYQYAISLYHVMLGAASPLDADKVSLGWWMMRNYEAIFSKKDALRMTVTFLMCPIPQPTIPPDQEVLSVFQW